MAFNSASFGTFWGSRLNWATQHRAPGAKRQHLAAPCVDPLLEPVPPVTQPPHLENRRIMVSTAASHHQTKDGLFSARRASRSFSRKLAALVQRVSPSPAPPGRLSRIINSTLGDPSSPCQFRFVFPSISFFLATDLLFRSLPYVVLQRGLPRFTDAIHSISPDVPLVRQAQTLGFFT